MTDLRLLDHVVGSMLASCLSTGGDLETFLNSFIFEREPMGEGFVTVHQCVLGGRPEDLGIWFDVVLKTHDEQVIDDIHALMQAFMRAQSCEVRYSISQQGAETIRAAQDWRINPVSSEHIPSEPATDATEHRP